MDNDPQDPSEVFKRAVEYHQAGRLPEAGSVYRQILEAHPDNADVNHLLGVLEYQSGQFETAANLIRRAIDIDAKQAPYHSNLALVLRAQGDLDAALVAIESALRITPERADAHLDRGAILRGQGRLEASLEACQQAVRINPGYAEAYNEQGIVHRSLGDVDEALACYQKACQLNPEFAEAHYNRGNALQAQGRLDDALAAYRHAISINPDYAEAIFNSGNVLRKLGRFDESLAAYQRALEIQPENADAHNGLGIVLQEQGQFEASLTAYERAIQINPDHANAHYNRGVILQERGKLTESIGAFRRALAIAPGFAEAYQALTQQKTFTDVCDDIRAMEVLLGKPTLADDSKMRLCFGLGKAYEDIGQFGRAFEFFLRANQLRRQTFDYDVSNEKRVFGKIKSVFNREFVERCSNHGYRGDVTPVFILGMPRSGTTLIEQILASHSDVYGAGEIEDLRETIAANPEGSAGQFPDYVSQLGEIEFARFGEAYLSRLKQRSNGERFVTDKLLSNYLSIGMIRLILPDARIIHCKRDPIDTCISCFKHFFRKGQYFAYDLVELGRYYKLYEDLMIHWSGLFPGQILDMVYEDVVSSQAAQTRRLLEFCGLDWDEACLAPHETQRQVRTASMVQIRRPVYRSSIRRWRSYEDQLQPLFEALR